LREGGVIDPVGGFGRDPLSRAVAHYYVKAAKPMPTFIVISGYDNPDLDTQGALLFGALCERDRACLRFTRMELHNHLSMVYQFNTADDALGPKSWNLSGAAGDPPSRLAWPR